MSRRRIDPEIMMAIPSSASKSLPGCATAAVVALMSNFGVVKRGSAYVNVNKTNP